MPAGPELLPSISEKFWENRLTYLSLYTMSPGYKVSDLKNSKEKSLETKQRRIRLNTGLRDLASSESLNSKN